MGEVTIEQYGEGQIVRGPGGRFLPGTKSPAPITHANARDMHARRYQLAALESRKALQRSIAESGVIDASIVNTPTKAWGALVGHAAELAMTSDSARGVADLSRFVGQATQMLADKTDRAEQSAPDHTNGEARILLAALRVVLRERGLLHDVIDGQARDARNDAAAE